MRKLRSVLCVLCLLLLVPMLLRARQILPLDTRPLVAEKYAGWTGVLRLWVFEGWPCGNGSLSPWLNACIARFEKRHPGVYVQPQYMDAGAMASLNDSGILPPDMLLFPPGLLTSADGLLALSPPEGLRPGLSRCGSYGGATYAVPVAMGGYLWAWNAALTDGIPDSWRESDVTLAVPEPTPWRRWDAALLGLCSGRREDSCTGPDGSRSENLQSGLDLGLEWEATPAPTPSPVPNADPPRPRHLPANFRYDSDAWRRFINGEVAAMPVTQREIRRLQALSDQGKGPDWRLTPGDAPFSDQLLSLAIVEKPDADEQQALCREFMAHLLTDECQGKLNLAAAFSVTGTDSGYQAGDPLATLDAVLHDDTLCVPPCFGDEWITQAESIVREFVADTEESPVLWQQLRDSLAKNPND